MSNFVIFDKIPIGTKIELDVVDPIEGKLNIGFISQIENFIDENTLQIAAPIFEARIYPLRVNSKMKIYTYHKNNVYLIVGYVDKRVIADELALLEIKITEKIQKVQRRQFFRFDCSVPISFYIPQDNTDEDLVLLGRTLDLSGGGLSANTEKPLKSGTGIKGLIELDDENIEFTAKVIRCESKTINEETKYTSSVSFIDMEYKNREKIIGYIFNQQRILLKKGR